MRTNTKLWMWILRVVVAVGMAGAFACAGPMTETQEGTTVADNKAEKICRWETPTGSRIERYICRPKYRKLQDQQDTREMLSNPHNTPLPSDRGGR